MNHVWSQVAHMPIHSKSIREHPLKRIASLPDGVSTKVLTTAASDHLGAKDSDSGVKIDLGERMKCRMMWLHVITIFLIFFLHIHTDLICFFVEKLHKHIHVCVFGLKFLSTFEYFPVYSSMILSHFSYQSFYQLPVAWNRGAFGVPKWTFERLSCVFTYFLYCGTGIAAIAKGVCIEVSGK